MAGAISHREGRDDPRKQSRPLVPRSRHGSHALVREGHDRGGPRRVFLLRAPTRRAGGRGGHVTKKARTGGGAATAKAAGKEAEEIGRTGEFIRRYGAGQRSKEARGRGKKLARVV